ncbi:probable serine/threonine-protein kinase DDB_G0280717 [Folsomia candida]|uniref:probable serine/threonine-protein kinase DDB_G0280717 n=1 Tax=Folsomia candida TaxID=158441 RepID=UPI001604D90A|nr:probable serine/threonine-protein kinase DDB_G0280717 [Folsomia candida]
MSSDLTLPQTDTSTKFQIPTIAYVLAIPKLNSWIWRTRDPNNVGQENSYFAKFNGPGMQILRNASNDDLNTVIILLNTLEKELVLSGNEDTENQIRSTKVLVKATLKIWIQTSQGNASYQNLSEILRKFNLIEEADRIDNWIVNFRRLKDFHLKEKDDFLLTSEHLKPITKTLNLPSLDHWFQTFINSREVYGLGMLFLENATEADIKRVLGMNEKASYVAQCTLEIWIQTEKYEATFNNFVRNLWIHRGNISLGPWSPQKRVIETLIGRREYLKGLSPLGKPENNPLPPAPPRAYSYLESNFDFTPEEPIGQGGYGKVFKTTFKADKKIYALKYFGMMEEDEDRESAVLQMLPPHPNIIRVINSWTESDIVQYLNPSIPPGPEKYHFIQMEYCSQGDLRNWLNHRELTHETDADQIFRQIISALAHLHGVQPKAIIHRDVKPENIFMQKDRNIKLGDFGLSREIDKFDMTSRTGTSFYKAPELRIRRGKTYDVSVDIYATGKICYELFCDSFSVRFDKDAWEEAMDKVEKFDFLGDFEAKWPEKVPLLKRMLDQNPSNRPSAATIQSYLNREITSFEIRNLHKVQTITIRKENATLYNSSFRRFF